MAMGARARRIKRITESNELGELVAKLRAHEGMCDRSWMTRHDSREDRALWLVTPLSHNGRREDALDDSNYDVAARMLNEVSSFGERCAWPDWTAQDGTVYPGVKYISGATATRHDAWPGGVIETLLVRIDDAPALRMLKSIIDALAYYPVLDDAHFSELEWERNHPSDHECYSEDGDDCPCAVRNHDHIGPDFLPEDADEDGEIHCAACGEYVIPGTRVGEGNTHGEDDGSNPDQTALF
jgi:hypothetical protein